MVSDSLGIITSFFGSVGHHLAELPASEAIIFDIGLILIIAAILAFIASLIKQPLIPSYVLAGIIIGPLMLNWISNLEVIYAFSEIGVAFLLFVAGLEISFQKIKEANLKKILFVGLIQSILIFAISYFMKGFFNLAPIEAAYIGVMLAFGSTMVDVKLLSEKKELVTLHGRIVLGILLLEDLIAIIAILIFTTGGLVPGALALSFIKFIGLLITAILLQKFVLGRIVEHSAKSKEVLFLTALATLFFFIILSHFSGISIVVGAFIAGVTLANSPYKTELESRVAPLRDFFGILFFVALGTQIVISGISEQLTLLAFMVIMGMMIKPLLDFILLRIMGYQERTSFNSAITLAQLSEFALIIGILGVSSGELNNSILSTVILATIITMSLSPYLFNYRNKMFKTLQSTIRFFDFLPKTEISGYHDGSQKDTLIVGAHRMGSIILKGLKQHIKRVIVLDFNPEITKALHQKKISYIYGEVRSPEIFNHIDVKKLKLIISTVPDYEENAYLLKLIKQKNPKARIIVTGARISEAKKLYQKGADYVIMPKVIAGEELAHILTDDKKKLKQEKKRHLDYLNQIHKILY